MENILAAVRAAADPTRLRLLAVLSRAELTVSELTHILGQSQPRISRHLRLMGVGGLLSRIQEGSWVFYRLAERGAGAGLARYLTDQLPADDPIMLRDLERLDAVRRARAAQASEYFRQSAAKWREVRALHIPEADLEQAIEAMVGSQKIRSYLDLGTGTGRLLELLGPHADHAIGVDSSREMLAIARTQLDKPGLRHIQVRQADLFALPFESASFDLVTVHLVLHFLDDPAAAVFEAARMLRKGGRLLIVDFAPHTLEFLREEHAHRRLGFPEEEVAGWFRAAGLKPIAGRCLEPPAETKDHLSVCLWLAEQTLSTNPARLLAHQDKDA